MNYLAIAEKLRAECPPTAPDAKADTLPYEQTAEGQRLAKFKRACPEEFYRHIDRGLLKNSAAFDRVAQWAGHFRGPTAVGDSSTAKTRAAWSALGRLWVKDGVGFSWWPVSKLVSEIDTADRRLEGLFWQHQASRIFFVDDADKINWAFDSNKEALFAFYDAIYRRNFPCVTTTNKPREWWVKQMGEAFARRLFDDAGFTVKF